MIAKTSHLILDQLPKHDRFRIDPRDVLLLPEIARLFGGPEKKPFHDGLLIVAAADILEGYTSAVEIAYLEADIDLPLFGPVADLLKAHDQLFTIKTDNPTQTVEAITYWRAVRRFHVGLLQELGCDELAELRDDPDCWGSIVLQCAPLDYQPILDYLAPLAEKLRGAA
jgi:hypothetical protein